MKFNLLPLLATLLIFATIPDHAVAQKSKKGNILEIFIESFEREDRIKNVKFELYKNGQELTETTSKKGRFSFVINQLEGEYKLRAEKDGYLTKEILFNTKDFPFDKEYEYQDVYLEFIPLQKNDTDYVYTGRMSYEPESRAYKVDKIDSSQLELEKKYKDAMKRLDQIYSDAVENGDGLPELEEYGYAKDFYKLALTAKPEDDYASLAYDRMDSLEKEMELIAQAQRKKAFSEAGEEEFKKDDFIVVDTVPEDDEVHQEDEVDEEPVEEEKPQRPKGEYYSVQLGAFIDWYDEAVYQDVPDKIVADGSDYKRILSGRFNNRDKARKRMEEMRAAGFEDAFLVTMQGDERVGF